MVYGIAASLMVGGLILIGISYHNNISAAWKAITASF